MSAAGPTSPAAPGVMPRDFGRRTRPRLLVRWRAYRRAAELDEALAAGRDPLADDCLLWRAQRLTEPIERLNFAETIQRIVARVDCGAPSPQPGPGLIRPDVIKNNRSLLLVLAERLQGDEPIGLRGLAMTELLVRYSESALYRGSALALKWRLLDILAMLDPKSSWAD